MAAKFELLLAIKDVEEKMVGSMQYYAELFEEETMVVMMRRLEHLLEEVERIRSSRLMPLVCWAWPNANSWRAVGAGRQWFSG